MRLTVRRVAGAVGFVATMLLGGLALAQETPPPEQYHLRVEFAQWTPKLAAGLRVGTDATPGTLLDLKSDLGVEDEKAKEWSGTLRLGRSVKLRGSETPIDYKGDTTLARTISFNGRAYPASERVVSSVKGRYYTGGLELDVVRTRGGFFGLMIGAQVFDMDAALEVPARNIREQRTRTLAIPVVGGTGRVYFGRMSLSAEAQGLTIGNRGHVYEVSAAAGVHVSDRLAVKGGYRRLKFHGENGADLLDLTMEGWHYGAEVSF